MDFAALPPEVNSALMYTGPGSGPILAAGTAWDQMASELSWAAASYQSAIANLTGGWLGPASVSMAAAAAPYASWMYATAAQAEQAATQAKAAATAYETAFAMTVPPPVIAANRAQLAALVATNFLGQNTAAIAATEAHYLTMWAQDAGAMYGYAGSAATATALPSFAPPKQNTNPGGLGSQAASTMQAAGTAAGSNAQTAAPQLAATVPQTLQGMAQPLQATATTGGGLSQTAMGTGASGLGSVAMGTGTSAASSAAYGPMSAMSALSQMPGQGVKHATKIAGESAGLGASASTAAAPAAFGSGADLVGLAMDTAGLEMDGVGFVGLDGGGVGLDLIGVGLDFLGADTLTESGGLGPLGSFGGLGPLGGLGSLGDLGGGAATSASVGQAAAVGSMSVPQAWSAAGPASLISSATPAPMPANGWSAGSLASAHGPAMPKLAFPAAAGGANSAVAQIGFRPSMIPHTPMAG